MTNDLSSARGQKYITPVPGSNSGGSNCNFFARFSRPDFEPAFANGFENRATPPNELVADRTSMPARHTLGLALFLLYFQ